MQAEAEANLARRIARERAARGWSHRTLAEQLTAAGMPVNASTVQRIETGRQDKVSVGMLVALARVFGRGVEQMLLPVELEDEQDALRIAQAALDQMGELYRVAAELERTLRELDGLAARNEDAYPFVVRRLEAKLEELLRGGYGRGPELRPTDEPIGDLIGDLLADSMRRNGVRNTPHLIVLPGAGVFPDPTQVEDDRDDEGAHDGDH